MSRIGNKPINIPETVTVAVTGAMVTIVGPKGQLQFQLPVGVQTKIQDGQLLVSAEASNLHGLSRALLANMVIGVTTGWTKSLELSGTGYRASVASNNLNLSLGFSHPVVVTPPVGITFSVAENTITVSGIDKVLVGEVAAKIRVLRPADPYKAKGLKYTGEVIRRKAGKAAKAKAGVGAK